MYGAHNFITPIGISWHNYQQKSQMFILVSILFLKNVVIFSTFPHYWLNLFLQTKISDLVQISPEDFQKPSVESIEDNINAKYANKVHLLPSWLAWAFITSWWEITLYY